MKTYIAAVDTQIFCRFYCLVRLATVQVSVALTDHMFAWPEAKKAHPWEIAWSVEVKQVKEVRNDPSLGESQSVSKY